MRRIAWVMVLIVVMVAGCTTCPKCGRSESVSTISDDLVINASEYAEFHRAVLEIANNNLDGLPAVLFRIATGSEVPSGTDTVVVNQAQFNRWFNQSDKGSFLSQTYWSVTGSMLKKRRILEGPTSERALDLAPAMIKDATKRARFLRRVHDLMDTSIEEY